MFRHFCITLATIVMFVGVLSTFTYSEDKEAKERRLVRTRLMATDSRKWSRDVREQISNLNHNIANKLGAPGLHQEAQASTQEQLNELHNKVQEIEKRLAAVESRVRAIF